MRRIGAHARTLVVNDALVALEAGAPGMPGVVIISGTGSIAYGRNAHNEGARVGRLGPRPRRRGQRLLDWPRRVARRAARGRSARTTNGADAAAACSTSASPQAQSLIHEVYQSNLQPAAIGALARCCAGRIQRWRRGRVGDPARCRRRARVVRASAWRGGSTWTSKPFPFILGGGIFRAVPWLRDEMSAAASRWRFRAARRASSTASPRLAPCRSRFRKRRAARGFRGIDQSDANASSSAHCDLRR